jgi:putative FmdB family regulatory protein
MPLYEYQCDNGHRFELIRKFSDPPLDACPTCGAPVRKLFSSPAIQFKGSGFYITDYARKDHTSSHSGESHGEGGSSDQGKEKADKAGTGDKGGKGDNSATDSSAAASTASTPAPAAKDTAAPKPAPKSDKN